MERYMLVYYYQKPTGKWDEVTEFRKNLRTKHLQSAKVILDFKEKKCVINLLNKEATFDDMLDFYKRLLGEELSSRLPAEFR